MHIKYYDVCISSYEYAYYELIASMHTTCIMFY
jgi:hypothetical protein